MLLINCSLFLPLVHFPVILPSRMSRNKTSCRRTCSSHLSFRWFIVLMIHLFSSTRFRTSELLTFAVQLISSPSPILTPKIRHVHLLVLIWEWLQLPTTATLNTTVQPLGRHIVNDMLTSLHWLAMQSQPRGRPKKTWREIVSRWMKQIRDDWWQQ